MTPKENLIKAKELLETAGWCQKTSRLRTGEYCLISAIIFTRGSEMLTDGGFRATCKYLLTFLPIEYRNLYRDKKAKDYCLPEDRYRQIIAWNDSPGRTKEQVFELLQKAIDAYSN